MSQDSAQQSNPAQGSECKVDTLMRVFHQVSRAPKNMLQARPINEYETEMIDNALEYTRQAILDAFPFSCVPVGDQRYSYNVRYLTLKSEYNRLQSRYPNFSAPKLFRFDQWEDSFWSKPQAKGIPYDVPTRFQALLLVREEGMVGKPLTVQQYVRLSWLTGRTLQQKLETEGETQTIFSSSSERSTDSRSTDSLSEAEQLGSPTQWMVDKIYPELRYEFPHLCCVGSDEMLPCGDS
ncbi:MAG: hypothetical protein Q9217_000828 [Psora testacea]